MPLPFVDVLILVDHPTLALRQAVDPVSVVSVAILIEEGTPSMLLVFIPIACVLSPQLGSFVLPVSALAMPLVDCPHTLVLVSILVELDAEAFLAVVSPVANILLGRLPHLSLDASILLPLLLLDPVHASVGSVLLGLRIVAVSNMFKIELVDLHFPEVHELVLWLHGLGILQHG